MKLERGREVLRSNILQLVADQLAQSLGHTQCRGGGHVKAGRWQHVGYSRTCLPKKAKKMTVTTTYCKIVRASSGHATQWPQTDCSTCSSTKN